MILFYDSKCQICRKLAHKIHFSSHQTVEIKPLTSEEASQTLNKFYPDGWAHDFYLVQNDTCTKGLTALPKLARAVGLRRMTALLGEYASYRLSPTSCGAAPNPRETQTSKRNFLKVAATAPLLAGFSKLAAAYPLADAQPEAGGFLVHVAEVSDDGAGGFRSKVYRCESCGRTPAKPKGVPTGSSAPLMEKTDLLETRVKALSTGNMERLLKIQKVEYEKPDSKMTAVASMLDHARYNLSVTVGQGRTTSLVGMAQHDLPLPAIDFVVVPHGTGDAAAYFAAYANGVQQLAKLHAQEGRAALAQVYGEMVRGLHELGARYSESVTDSFVPTRNELVLTSMPEALRFFGLPNEIRQRQLKESEAPSSCDCSCSCGVCCGCGITLGICIGEGCGCCSGCGCGCGCCL